jgi:transcriptional regulator with XRE-family HTH domain
MSEAVVTRAPVGDLLRDWRQRRRLSQLDLALEAGVSARHVSFVETGRSKPSADMVLQLAEQLEVPLRDRNQMLLAAGYAPVYGEHDLSAPEMKPVRSALELVLAGHEPYPAVVVDRQWNRVLANAPTARLLEGVSPSLLVEPLNVLRVSLHPFGMAPYIVNLGEWRAHLLHRLAREIALTGDPGLSSLLAELSAYPGVDEEAERAQVRGGQASEIVATLRLRRGDAELSFFSTVTTFGTAVDITVSELSVEAFFPADAFTADYLRGN